MEPGETWEQATRRECLEETGWEVNLHGLLGIYSDPATQIHRYPGGNTVHFFGAVFLGSPLRLVGSTDREAELVEWFRLDELPAPIFIPDLPVLRDAIQDQDRPFVR